MWTTPFIALTLACAPQVDPDTAAALVQVESAFNPWAIGVVGGALTRQPRSRTEALATARALRQAGWDFSVGLAQINVGNLARLGMTLDSAFDPCTNLAAMQTVLIDCFDRATKPTAPGATADTAARSDPAQQSALRSTLACYYSGTLASDRQHAYVQRVVVAASALRHARFPALPIVMKEPV